MITECNHTTAKICPECVEKNRFEQLKADLRKIVKEMGNKPGCSEEFWAWKIERLYNGGE